MDHDLSQSRAVLIGNGNFSDKVHLPRVPAARCLSAVSQLLTSSLCNWPKNSIEQIRDVTNPSTLAIKVQRAVREARDVLFVYYVGHGLRTRDGQLALVLQDTKVDSGLLPHTSMLYDNLASMLRDCPAATKLVMLDCCHAELGNKSNFRFQSGEITEAYPVDGLYFIGASKAHLKAKFDDDLTYFTKAFISTVSTGIRGYAAELRMDQIFIELRTRLLVAGLPEPVESGIRGAHMYPFAVNAARLEPPTPHQDEKIRPVRLAEAKTKSRAMFEGANTSNTMPEVSHPGDLIAAMVRDLQRTSLPHRSAFLYRIVDKRPTDEIVSLFSALRSSSADAEAAEILRLVSHKPVNDAAAFISQLSQWRGYEDDIDQLLLTLSKRTPNEIKDTIAALRTQRSDRAAERLTRLAGQQSIDDVIELTTHLRKLHSCQGDLSTLLRMLADRPAPETAAAIDHLRRHLSHQNADAILKFAARRPVKEIPALIAELDRLDRRSDRERLLQIANRRRLPKSSDHAGHSQGSALVGQTGSSGRNASRDRSQESNGSARVKATRAARNSTNPRAPNLEETASRTRRGGQTKPHVNTATIGQIDHGKTTLTAAIAKVLHDTYPDVSPFTSFHEIDAAAEQQDRGIATLISHVEYQTAKRQYTQVDCPGHADCVKNLITGATRIDGAILVVAATDGPMPQTRQQVLLARQVGVPHLVVALNKADLMRERELELAELKVRELLTECGFAGDDVPVVRVSALRALEGDGEWSEKVLELVAAFEDAVPDPTRQVDKPFLMPVEEVFPITGRGVVVAGRIERGVIRSGDAVDIIGITSKPTRTTVAGVEMFRRILDEGQAGDNVGLLLSDIKREEVERGQAVVTPGTAAARTRFNAQVYALTHDEGGRHTPFFNNYRPQFYIRTAGVTGVVHLLEGTEMILPGENAEVEVELLQPMAMEDRLRFAMRDGGRTVGGGRITKVLPQP